MTDPISPRLLELRKRKERVFMMIRHVILDGNVYLAADGRPWCRKCVCFCPCDCCRDT